MSIYTYAGLPRSGKSYNVVANVILPALREGRRVVTNVPVYRDKVMCMEGVAGELVDFPVLEVSQDPELIRKYVLPGDVFVLDEVWRLWPQGLKSNEVPECYKSLLAEHGHMVDVKGRACHIVLVTQDLSLIAAFARKLVEQTFIHTKMGHLGQEGRFRVDIYHGAVTGVIGPQKQRLREIYGTYRAEIWGLYKSHTLSEARTDGANEKSVDRRGNVLLKPWILFGVPACVMVFVGCMWYLNREGDRMMHPKPPAAVPSAAHPGFLDSARRPDAGVLGRFAGAVASVVRYRLVGYVEVPGDAARSKALLVSDSGLRVERSMSHCRWIDGDYLECEIDSHWYGIAGDSLVAHETGAVPVSLPKSGPGNAPLAGASAALLSVAKGAARPAEDAVEDTAPVEPAVVGVASLPDSDAYAPEPLEQDAVTGVVAYRTPHKSAAARP